MRLKQELQSGLYRQSGISAVAYVGMALGIALLVAAVFVGLKLRLEAQTQESVDLIIAIESALQSYQETYDQLPGDDGPLALLSIRGEQWESLMSGDADGNLEAPDFRAFTGVDESGAFWQHMRAAGLLPGDPVIAGIEGLPTNVFGGRVGVLSQDMGGGLDGIKLCLSRIPGAAAELIDATLDDGAGDVGRLRANLANSDEDSIPVDELLAAPYNSRDFYTLCYRVQ